MSASTTATAGGAFQPDQPINFSGAVDFSSVPTQGAASVVTTTGTQTLSNKNVISPVTTIAGDGAITIASSTIKLTKGSAAAITLAAPTAAQEGTEISIVAQSAFAHVVTATGLIDDGVTGGSKNTWTAAAFVGSSLTLVALGLKWSVLSKNLGTIA